MGVAQLAAQWLDFRAGLAGDEDERDAATLDFFEGWLRPGPRIGAMVEERAIEIGEDEMFVGEHFRIVREGAWSDWARAVSGRREARRDPGFLRSG